jgi:hypothetical protein
LNAAEILDAVARKHSDCALIREVLVTDPEADRFAAADAWSAAGRPGRMPRFEPTARRIDGLLFDGGQSRTALEVKISRSDYLRETDAKRRMWRAITNRFVYVTPTGLLRAEEIPDGCGLWEVDDNGRVSIVRRARVNKSPEPIPHQVLVAIAYRLKTAERAARPVALSA